MVDSLELQTPVEEVQPRGAIDVHGRAQHLLGEGLGNTQVGGAHREVGEGDLDVERGGDGVGDHDEGEAVPGAGDGLVDNEVAEPGPEEELADDFEVAEPPGLALSGALAEEEVGPAEAVEVEAADGHDGVVGVVLDVDHEFGEGVVLHCEVVVGGCEVLEEAVGDGEERHVFDVRVVFGGIGDEMVHVVVLLPPTGAETAAVTGYEHGQGRIDVEVMGDTHVCGIMDYECELVP